MSPRERDSVDLRLGKLLRAARPLRPGRELPCPRSDEPTDDELLLYVDGTLGADEMQRFEARLAAHPFSSDRVEILREALAECGFRARLDPDEVPAAEPLQNGQVARLVFAVTSGANKLLTFLRGSDQPTLLPQAALATRSAAAAVARESYLYELKKRFDDCDVLVQVDGLGDSIELRLTLSCDGQPLADGRATLKRRGKLDRSQRIREGTVDFGDLEPDSYAIELRRNGDLLGRVDLEFLRA